MQVDQILAQINTLSFSKISKASSIQNSFKKEPAYWRCPKSSHIKYKSRCHLLNIILTTSDPLSLERATKKGRNRQENSNQNVGSSHVVYPFQPPSLSKLERCTRDPCKPSLQHPTLPLVEPKTATVVRTVAGRHHWPILCPSSFWPQTAPLTFPRYGWAFLIKLTTLSRSSRPLSTVLRWTTFQRTPGRRTLGALSPSRPSTYTLETSPDTVYHPRSQTLWRSTASLSCPILLAALAARHGQSADATSGKTPASS
jgi:hypothetical protein